MSAIFQNFKSEEIFRIVDNIWEANTSNWDVETKGRKVTIRTQKGAVALEIENIPEDKFIIHRLNMCYKGYQITSDNSGVEITKPNGEEIFTFESGSEIKGDIVINISNGQIHLNRLFVKSEGDMKIKGNVSNSVFVGNGKNTITFG